MRGVQQWSIEGRRGGRSWSNAWPEHKRELKGPAAEDDWDDGQACSHPCSSILLGNAC